MGISPGGTASKWEVANGFPFDLCTKENSIDWLPLSRYCQTIYHKSLKNFAAHQHSILPYNTTSG
jgi:hypothetical protein